MEVGERVAFVGWYETDLVLTGTVTKVKEKQTGNSIIINCDMGGSYEVPERFVIGRINKEIC